MPTRHLRAVLLLTACLAAAKQLVVKADSSTTVQLDDATKLLRVAPGEKDLAGLAARPLLRFVPGSTRLGEVAPSNTT